MILAFSLRPIPFYQDNCSFHFDADKSHNRIERETIMALDADDNSRCLSFPVFFFCLALFCSVFFYISLQLIKVGGVKVLTPSRHDCLGTMKL